ncbi:MAG: thioesterase family protein [Paludibacteraceae bacterium]|nr:thioesterase family protein [Paludibacteraceae bacterium]
MLQTGLKLTQTHIVQENDTAVFLGSGSLPVYATPALVAFMENTAVKSISNQLEKGNDSVGISIQLNHTKASKIGEEIFCSAELTYIDGRKLTFHLEAKNAKGEIIGTATHDRFIILPEKFMSKLS